jgi:hypothetical protein
MLNVQLDLAQYKESNMLTLHPKQVCPYMSNCPYIKNTINLCKGVDPNRNNVFVCEFISDNGGFIETYGYQKRLQDQKGKVRILLE